MSSNLRALSMILPAVAVAGLFLTDVPANAQAPKASKVPATTSSGFFFSPALSIPVAPVRPAAVPTRVPQRALPAAAFYGRAPGSIYADQGAPGYGSEAYEDPYGDQNYSATPSSAARLPLNLFSIFGIPNKSGEILWPLGFRLLPDSRGTKVLLLQTNAQFLAAMGQRATGAKADRAVVGGLRQSLRRLRFILVNQDAMLGNGIYVEAREFLDRLDQAAALLEDQH